MVADMRALPLGSDRLGGVLAFYSLIHVRRTELALVLAEFHRVLRPGGSILLSAHEGTGELEVDTFLGEPVVVVATLFTLDELVATCRQAGLTVTRAQRRDPYPSEHESGRLYVGATRAG
jgi:SAM-dependent methyltransferase